VAHRKIVSGELRDSASVVFGQIDESFVVDVARLPFEEFGSRGFPGSDCSSLTKIILNHGQELSQIGLQPNIEKISVLGS